MILCQAKCPGCIAQENKKRGNLSVAALL